MEGGVRSSKRRNPALCGARAGAAPGKTKQTKQHKKPPPACTQPRCELILMRCPHASGCSRPFHQSQTPRVPRKTQATRSRSSTCGRNCGRHSDPAAAETLLTHKEHFMPQLLFPPSRVCSPVSSARSPGQSQQRSVHGNCVHCTFTTKHVSPSSKDLLFL